MYKQTILKYIFDYLKLKKIEYKKSGKVIMFSCLFCEYKDNKTATIIPNTSIANCYVCKQKYNLIDIVKKVEPEKMDLSEEEILQYLKELFNIEVTTKKDKETAEEMINKLLNFYEKNKWSLLAIAANSKIPVEEMKGWTTKEYRDKNEWKRWLYNIKLNLGVRSGKVSNITVIDIDILNNKEKKEFRFEEITENRKKELINKREEGLKMVYNEIKDIMGEPLIQENLGGEHLIYQYDEDFPKTKAKIANINIDIENDGGYILIEPSKLGITTRQFKKLKTIPKIPSELKKFLKEKITIPRKTNSELVRENIKTGDFKVRPEDFKLKDNNLEGNCNTSFVSLGGILRKELNPIQTEFVLQTFNRHLLESPMNNRTVSAMCKELEYYDFNDEQELTHEILKHIKEVKKVTKSDLELAIAGGWTKGESKKRFNKAIQYLLKEGRITQRGKKIGIVEDLDWTDTLINEGTPVDFKVPYFHNYVYFCRGDIIILGSQKKYGKTHLAMNMIKRLVAQGIKPYYIYNEKQGGRFAKIALHLGLKDGDFWKARCSDPERLILRPNSITIYDWVRPNKEDGFARTDLLFSNIVQKTEKTNSFLICLVQLRRNDTFFAGDQIGQDTSLLVRYVYEKENEGTYTKFILDDTRERKFFNHTIEIPSIYNSETKEVKLIEELSEKEQKQLIKKLEKFKEKNGK